MARTGGGTNPACPRAKGRQRREKQKPRVNSFKYRHPPLVLNSPADSLWSRQGGRGSQRQKHYLRACSTFHVHGISTRYIIGGWLASRGPMIEVVRSANIYCADG